MIELEQAEEFEKVKDDDADRWLVYRDLKEKRKMVTSGIKYGVDFLVYSIGKNAAHSEYMVLVRNGKEEIGIKELILSERTAMNAKKTLVLASVINGVVSYLRIKYAAD